MTRHRDRSALTRFFDCWPHSITVGAASIEWCRAGAIAKSMATGKSGSGTWICLSKTRIQRSQALIVNIYAVWALLCSRTVDVSSPKSEFVNIGPKGFPALRTPTCGARRGLGRSHLVPAFHPPRFGAGAQVVASLSTLLRFEVWELCC